jgi:mono/diheme cytochrome c family protein
VRPHDSRALWIGVLILACLLSWAGGVQAQDTAHARRTAPIPLSRAASAPAEGSTLPRDSREAAVFRGGLVFANYCVTCHGINADGNGRAARLYDPRPANLRVTDKNDAYLGLIVKMGGQAMGRSPFMPPWGAELTEEQMRDIVAYVRSLNLRADATP